MRQAIKVTLFCLALNSLLFAGDYRFVKIDFPNAIATTASSINARGDISGRYDDANGVVHGFLLRKGVFSTIDFPHASFTSARAMNARGDIAGRKMPMATTTDFCCAMDSSRKLITREQPRP